MERIAIIGTGIAGLTAAWRLREMAAVTLFDRADRPGGHTNTVTVEEDGSEVPIDTGFIVFNKVTYPNLCILFEELGVEVQPSEMSFSVHHEPDDLEYNGMGLSKVFAQRKNLLRLRFYRLLIDINRFFAVARTALDSPPAMTVGQFAEKHRLGPDFLEYYLVPMSSAIWSTRPEDVLEFPVEMLIRFFHNHGFLGVRTHHQWFTVTRGAINYVRRILDRIADCRLGDPVTSVSKGGSNVVVKTANGISETFDRVIMATHADEALALLETPSEVERSILGAFGYQRNQATLHTDASVMPRRKVAWASWNYRISDQDGSHSATTHYWMNALQNVSRKRDYFVSINARDQIDPGTILYETIYDHPVFTRDALMAQSRVGDLNELARDSRIYFCGSYHRYGFHEDACWSALEAWKTLCRHAGNSSSELPMP